MTVEEQLTVDLWLLDALLTGKDPRSGRGDPDKLIDTAKFINGEAYYLSDGGYSRLHCNYRGELFLGSESRDQVKVKWDNHAVQTTVYRIQKIIEANGN